MIKKSYENGHNQPHAELDIYNFVGQNWVEQLNAQFNGDILKNGEILNSLELSKIIEISSWLHNKADEMEVLLENHPNRTLIVPNIDGTTAFEFITKKSTDGGGEVVVQLFGEDSLQIRYVHQKFEKVHNRHLMIARQNKRSIREIRSSSTPGIEKSSFAYDFEVEKSGDIRGKQLIQLKREYSGPVGDSYGHIMDFNGSVHINVEGGFEIRSTPNFSTTDIVRRYDRYGHLRRHMDNFSI